MGEALALAKWAVEFKPVPPTRATLAYTLYKKRAYKEADEAIKKHLNYIPINLTIVIPTSYSTGPCRLAGVEHYSDEMLGISPY